MVRTGKTKVRTGCLTCKARKVKCDEARPHCNRCVNTGRNCDGYSPPPRGHFTWQQLLSGSPSPSLTWPATVSRDELRSLDFFRHSVAPTLCFTLNTSFWTHCVHQAMVQDAATRHAVSAVASLYEHFKDSVGVIQHTRLEDTRAKAGRAFALRQYNHAIRELLQQKDRATDLNELLVVSLLFTCIEFLQGNAQAAIQHCRYGIVLGSSSGPPLEISELFNHLSIFPLFFGASTADMPPLLGEDSYDYSLSTASEAQRTLDRLLVRSARLVRSSADYRIERRNGGEPASFESTMEMLQRQRERLIYDLGQWMHEFSRLRREASSDVKDPSTSMRLLEMQHLLCNIWVSTCLEPDELAYDSYLVQFKRIVCIARAEKRFRSRSSAARRPLFTFEMGFAPLLHLMILKCRFLHLRLEALALMRAISSARESIWDSETMFAINARFIEMEHGCKLDLEATAPAVSVENHTVLRMLPSNEHRVCDSAHGDSERIVDETGKESVRVKIFFFRQDAEGQMISDWTWASVEPREC